ncbi:helix-turn-helix domain-containing protein [Bradyrhizobium sediminis]|uniref:Helix-turn-helix domain-containing protein n=1 Tax=Bradyrhizobium sediminis TaxID=2840469 RepID=A0A975NME2_9BRAD|nr:XRE family transcriptional regulator [Bradyrhizobium sediminis]QWG17843.1 helix-turn-helix domain-containing protein [Bradyrhizobium sediminis]
MLTPFGIAVRKLRLDKGMRLLDLAEATGRSSAFISAIETGRKPIPDAYLLSVARAMKLSAAEIRELRRAADRTRKEVPVATLPADQRELVAAFARKIDELPLSMMADLKKVILKSKSDDVPFHRKRRGIYVPPMSTEVIRGFAEKVRSTFVDNERIDFPIMEILEFKMASLLDGFHVDVQDKESMGSEEGRVVAGENIIVLREDVYEGAWKENGRDRFTACHEFAHFLMHRTVTMARMRDDGEKIYCDAEWQADTFAGSLLMSTRHLSRFKSPDDAAVQCKMSAPAAEVMWTKYQAEGRFGQ